VPCFVFTDSDTPGVIKGSGRTYGDTHLKDMLDYCEDLLCKYGGHKEAAGVSVELAKFEDMKIRMSEYVSNLPQKEIDDHLYYDLEIDAKDISKYIQEQNVYEPFGQGNPKPVFLIRNFEVLGTRAMGTNSDHLKQLGKYGDAVGFGMVEKYKQMGEPRKVNIVGRLSENFFKGNCTPQVEIIDMEESKGEIFKNDRTKMLERAIANKLEERRAI
jgi:single-stranded-DNA-specific exonuclease